VPKKELTTFFTRLKVLKVKNTIIRTFDLVPKSVPTTFITRSKVLIMVLLAFKTFDLVPKSVCPTLALDLIKNKTFNLVKNNLALDRMHY
jgi:hypothetical protein